MARNPLRFERFENDCLVITNRVLNRDGYYRPRIGDRSVLYHRYVWEEVHGKIPEGFEINHKCKNRACCNLNHLELLSREEHAIETNLTRYSAIKSTGYELWLSGMKPKDIAKQLGRTHSAVCYWIRSWKLE